MNYVTYSDLIQIGILIVSLFVLFQGNKKKYPPCFPARGYFLSSLGANRLPVAPLSTRILLQPRGNVNQTCSRG